MATEQRLIDANALRKKAIWGKIRQGTVYESDAKVVTTGSIDTAPTIEARPVVHGRWVVNVNFNNGERIIATCSNCKVRGEVRTDRNEWGIWHIDSPFCPNCGADMRKMEDDKGCK